jgi:UDP-GlcNAc3NAcA epimerase
MKIASIVGARPQFIKAAVVSRSLRKLPGVHEILIHTGQHYDANMSDVFFAEMDIPQPDVHLGIGSGQHGEQTGRMLVALETTFLQHAPDCVLVFGDTNSTLAAALAAAKLNIPIAHVEAGLRSFNRAMPEEINRVLTDHLSTWLFAPTDTAVHNLVREGLARENIATVGDVMYDAALYYAERARASTVLQSYGLVPRSYILCTIHRAENTDDVARLRTIVESLRLIARQAPILWPIHPRTRAALTAAGIDVDDIPNLHLAEPLGYLDMTAAESSARLIITDSGGVQKEAFFHGVGCLTLREETEWVELVQLGWNDVVPPTSTERVYNAAVAALEKPRAAPAASPYGNGHAGDVIAEHLVNALR